LSREAHLLRQDYHEQPEKFRTALPLKQRTYDLQDPSIVGKTIAWPLLERAKHARVFAPADAVKYKPLWSAGG
jgi:hypothetical protein